MADMSLKIDIPLLEKIYDDLFHPSFKTVGSWVKKKLDAKLIGVPEEQRQIPPKNIIEPILYNVYLTEDIPDLSEMYLNLLASSINSSTSTIAHPAYIKVIEQLTSDEARILSNLYSIRSTAGDDLCLAHLSDNLNKHLERLEDIWSKLCVDADIEVRSNSAMYMENLIRLKLINRESHWAPQYQPAGYNEHSDYDASVHQEGQEWLSFSEFGINFMYASSSETEYS